MTRRRTLPLQIGGLKTVFPAFMGRGAVKPRALPGGKKRKRGLDEKRTCEEHVISIIASLSFHLVEVGPRALGFSFGFRASKSVSRARSGRDARATEPVVVELAAVVVVVSSVVVSSVVEGLGAMRMRA